MKILLANMPWTKDNRSGVRAGSRWPHLKDPAESNYLPFPFFLAYSAALLEKNGFTVELIDAICDEISPATFLRLIDDFDPDLFVAETSTLSLQHDLLFIAGIEKRFKIALCGPDKTIQDPLLFETSPYIDFVLRGEYEFALLELANALRDGTDSKDVRGLNYRAGESIMCYVNEDRPLGDINSLPWPKRTGLSMHRYLDSPGEMPFPTVQMLASRGCPYGCLFCLWPQVMYGGQTYRVRDAFDVLDEMEEMVKTFRFRSIYFDDDTFGLNKEWLREFCEQFIKRNKEGRINVPWAMMTRPDVVDIDTLELLKKTGLWAVKYGMESADQTLVNNICKGLDVEYAKQMIRYTHTLGIKTHLTFTFGLPGETKKTIAHTIKTVLDLEPFSVQFSITTPFPGTKYFEQVKKNGHLTSRKLEDYDGNTKSVIRTESLRPAALVRAKNRAYRVWNRQRATGRLKKRLKKTKCFCERLRFDKRFFLFVWLLCMTVVYYVYLTYAKVIRKAEV
jgi:anaerobic magnesium-protoporphyrin IX monomethyl ester cyclase